ncbi:type 2 isopentenyl-diphosphate Delta-isomerase [Desulfoscipio gibsoniae]|uniref:Isopentenyl-diphosphate delta-isomerase n=1 Tax=Desulfoscipio gibsoniae DSM 7213 TaxID=767817 RepID=R4KH24_9FIRM|nr:type 2 isopentenyl-diphosphate Delta-isomerase [Desulfoscipio gibsoniae]AGL00952.1 isopentenyl-diphosphate delta-isomerase, type 2 [Desulfoscipio gibsoniae DSM 7213]
MRKLEHIKYAMELPEVLDQSGFADLLLVHNALPELDWDKTNTSCSFMGKQLSAPLMINAITGGHAGVLEINRGLAKAAAATGIAMAVGSQRAALDDPAVRNTFCVAREENPRGLLLANLSAFCTLEEALEAVNMIEADGIQLYLNVNQELVMREGEVNFSGALENIRNLVLNLPVPVLVKEVGCGMARKTVLALANAGVHYIDVSGFGGTNFAAIEGMRGGKNCASLEHWGIPTAVSLLEALSVGKGISVVASGGVRTAEDMAKALAAGASLVAMAGPFLRVLKREGPERLIIFINELITNLRRIMMLTGAQHTTALAQQPLVITGLVGEWLKRRGIDINKYAVR